LVLRRGAQASEAAEEGDLDEAVAICRKQLALDPNYAPAHEHLPGLLVDTGRDAEGLELIRRVIEGDPENVANRLLAGALYLRNGRARLASAEFKRALALDPGERAYLAIGLLYLDAGKVKQAITHLDRAAKIGSYETVSQIIRSMLDLRRADEAERYLQRAQELEPEHPESYLFRAGIHFYRFQLDEAEQALATLRRVAAGKAEYEEIVEDARRLRESIQSSREIEAMIRRLERETVAGFGPPPRRTKRR